MFFECDRHGSLKLLGFRRCCGSVRVGKMDISSPEDVENEVDIRWRKVSGTVVVIGPNLPVGAQDTKSSGVIYEPSKCPHCRKPVEATIYAVPVNFSQANKFFFGGGNVA